MKALNLNMPSFLALFMVYTAVGFAADGDCRIDYFEKLYKNPTVAVQGYEKVLAKMGKGLPPTKEQREILFREILELPDPPDGIAQAHLYRMRQIAWGWDSRVVGQAPDVNAITSALLLRQLIVGKPMNYWDTNRAIRCLVDHTTWFPDGSASVWKHRVEVALIKDGEQREWTLEKDSGGAANLHPEDSSPIASSLGADVLKAIALNPSAKSHKVALVRLLHAARIIEGNRYRNTEGYPRSMTQALIGYLDPKIIPTGQRDPEIERQVREILPKLGINYRDGEVDEWLPR